MGGCGWLKSLCCIEQAPDRPAYKHVESNCIGCLCAFVCGPACPYGISSHHHGNPPNEGADDCTTHCFFVGPGCCLGTCLGCPFCCWFCWIFGLCGGLLFILGYTSAPTSEYKPLMEWAGLPF